MDPQYLDVADEARRYYWDRFDMYPEKKSKCPRDVFNLWPGFAAEKMKTDLGSLRAAAALLPGSFSTVALPGRHGAQADHEGSKYIIRHVARQR